MQMLIGGTLTILITRNSDYNVTYFGKKFMDACDGHATEKTCAWLFDGFIEETAGNTPSEKQR